MTDFKRLGCLLAIVVLLGVGVAELRYVERTREIEGTWVLGHEASYFYEGKFPPKKCSVDYWASWFQDLEGIDPEASKLVMTWGNGRLNPTFSVRFVGRKVYSFFPTFGYGHLNAHQSQYEVKRLITIRPIASCRIR
ncbi:hypothetical protein MTR62_20115 [Novosphingobium sp. 1949]|uniref:Uncharacterized protein n=1 Tax=Novosphingobium organovorum TaxID=2930092 RepID=A0ABT0BIV2_9SPHN|nr:hypothetical protein [Novosphingobium organovorum]MCJ2184972.1 hypothetical protein [Novosphingobium organovorum]